MRVSARIIFSLLACLYFTNANGQATIIIRHTNRDTAYIKEYYRNHLIIRAYESTKFNNYKLIDDREKLIYKPNDHNNFGIGFNYKFIGLNIGFYLPFADKSIGIYGHTKDVDAQLHVYLRKFIVDFYGQFYRGYYLSNSSSAINHFPDDQFEKRPDINTRNVSIVFQYLFNDKRFSYNAPFFQNEMQKKSAGSFLLGGGIYHTSIAGDSTLTPANISYANFFNNTRFSSAVNSSITINGGYAYTLVIKKHFFATAIASGGAGLNYATLSNSSTGEKESKPGPELNFTVKLAAGYNSDRYFAGVTYIRLVTEDNSLAPHMWQEVNAGNFRFTVAERFRLKKSLLPKSDLLDID